MGKKSGERAVIHLVLCPNPDFLHGEKGRGEVAISYLFIPNHFLYLHHRVIANVGVAEMKLKDAPGRTWWIEDVDENLLIQILHDNPDVTIHEPDVWRVCAHCRAKGVRGWNGFTEPAESYLPSLL